MRSDATAVSPAVSPAEIHAPASGSSRYVVAEVGEIPPGGRKIVDLDGISVGVFHVNGEYAALLNWCPHQAARLCEGQLWSALEGSIPGDYHTSREGEVIACIWHGWEFDLRTGQSWCEPERLRVRAYDVSVQPGSAIQTDANGAAGTDTAPAQERQDARTPAGGRRKGPFVATTFPVSMEGRYIVVDLSRTASDLTPSPLPPRTPAADAVRA
jgi:3-phenylpropionate/trans-cinnamate dioxygenase ferredoxin subunit